MVPKSKIIIIFVFYFSIGVLQTNSIGSSEEQLQIEFYTFEQIYRMLLIEVNQDEIIKSIFQISGCLITLDNFGDILENSLTDKDIRNIEIVMNQIKKNVKEPYVVQGIEEFIIYIYRSKGKKFSQISYEMSTKTIKELESCYQADKPVFPNRTKAMNYPNPFNSGTSILFHLPKDGHVTIYIYNLLGQRVATVLDKFQYSGNISVNWNGIGYDSTKLPSGIYLYKIFFHDVTITKKMTLIN